MGNLCCQYTGCAWRRHPGLQIICNIADLWMRGWLVWWLLLSLGWWQAFLLCPADDRRISPGLPLRNGFSWWVLLFCTAGKTVCGLYWSAVCWSLLPGWCDSSLEWTQVSVARGDFCGFILDSEMGLPDFPGLEFCWSWWPGWMCLCAFKLIFSWRYWECVLVGRSKWVGPHLRGDGSTLSTGEYCTWRFCNLTVNLGMHIGPVRGLSARR